MDKKELAKYRYILFTTATDMARCETSIGFYTHNEYVSAYDDIDLFPRDATPLGIHPEWPDILVVSIPRYLKPRIIAGKLKQDRYQATYRNKLNGTYFEYDINPYFAPNKGFFAEDGDILLHVIDVTTGLEVKDFAHVKPFDPMQDYVAHA